MVVPVDLLKPVYEDLLTLGRQNKPPRPWLGLYATEIDGKVVVAGLANNAPARRADIHTGDIVMSLAGKEIGDLGSLYRSIWALGPAGVEVPMVVFRDGRTMTINLRSADRASFLKKARLQ